MKNINILYFASLREQLNQSNEQVAFDGDTLEDLKKQLASRGQVWMDALIHNKNLLVSLNQTRVQADPVLQDGDEVAFFPPVTGG